MPPFVYFFADGSAFFAGWGAAVVAMLSMIGPRRWWKRAAQSVGLVGEALIYLSATPMPAIIYLVWLTAAIGWVVIERQRRFGRGVRWAARAAVVAATIAPLAMELPYHLRPAVPQTPARRLYVVGDSVSSGLGEPGGRRGRRRSRGMASR